MVGRRLVYRSRVFPADAIGRISSPLQYRRGNISGSLHDFRRIIYNPAFQSRQSVGVNNLASPLPSSSSPSSSHIPHEMGKNRSIRITSFLAIRSSISNLPLIPFDPQLCFGYFIDRIFAGRLKKKKKKKK